MMEHDFLKQFWKRMKSVGMYALLFQNSFQKTTWKYSNFLFLNREGLPKVAGNYEGMVRGLIKKYNKYHTDKLPNITPHSFRHTYCTNMANRGMNPNTLQYLMGHANITMTLGYYAHGTFQSAKAELERLAC